VEQIRAAVGKGAAASSGLAARAELDALTANLYRDLLAPAFARLTKRIVYVAPHGPLHYLPFAAISDGREHLIDRYTLLTTPSGTVLTYLAKKQKTAPATTVVLANPDVGDRALDLPYAEREGAIVQARRAGTILFSRSDATKGRLREWAPKSGVLHVAAHARLDVRRPLQSAVLLAPGEGHEGRLTAGEVFGLTLPSTLVVLSACETGLGSLASGDELIGLTRAFMYAGAPQVVATLWRISDESTAELMDEFYGQLRTQPPAQALRAAQLRLRTRYPDPFYWAAFSVFGHAR
jgi:CHAT domain-containing protein